MASGLGAFKGFLYVQSVFLCLYVFPHAFIWLSFDFVVFVIFGFFKIYLTVFYYYYSLEACGVLVKQKGVHSDGRGVGRTGEQK